MAKIILWQIFLLKIISANFFCKNFCCSKKKFDGNIFEKFFFVAQKYFMAKIFFRQKICLINFFWQQFFLFCFAKSFFCQIFFWWEFLTTISFYEICVWQKKFYHFFLTKFLQMLMWLLEFVQDVPRNLPSLVKIGSVTADIFLIWTNVARTNVACTNLTMTAGICQRRFQEPTFEVSSQSSQ